MCTIPNIVGNINEEDKVGNFKDGSRKLKIERKKETSPDFSVTCSWLATIVMLLCMCVCI